MSRGLGDVYKRQGYLHIFSLQTIILVLLVLFLLPFSDKLVEWDENDQITQALTAVEEPLPYVPLAEMGISPDWVQTPYDPITIGGKNSDSNYVRSRSNVLAPATFQISQTAYHTDPNMPAVATSMTSYYGEMANSFLAKVVGMDFANLYADTPAYRDIKWKRTPFPVWFFGSLLWKYPWQYTDSSAATRKSSAGRSLRRRRFSERPCRGFCGTLYTNIHTFAKRRRITWHIFVA